MVASNCAEEASTLRRIRPNRSISHIEERPAFHWLWAGKPPICCPRKVLSLCFERWNCPPADRLGRKSDFAMPSCARASTIRK